MNTVDMKNDDIICKIENGKVKIEADIKILNKFLSCRYYGVSIISFIERLICNNIGNFKDIIEYFDNHNNEELNPSKHLVFEGFDHSYTFKDLMNDIKKSNKRNFKDSYDRIYTIHDKPTNLFLSCSCGYDNEISIECEDPELGITYWICYLVDSDNKLEPKIIYRIYFEHEQIKLYTNNLKKEYNYMDSVYSLDPLPLMIEQLLYNIRKNN